MENSENSIKELQAYAATLRSMSPEELLQVTQARLTLLMHEAVGFVVAIETLKETRPISPQLQAFVALFRMMTAGGSSRMSTVLSPAALSVSRHFEELSGDQPLPSLKPDRATPQPIALVEDEDHLPAGVISLSARRKNPTVH